MSELNIVSRYTRFIFKEYEKDPHGWITKTPPSVEDFRTGNYLPWTRCPYCEYSELEWKVCPICLDAPLTESGEIKYCHYCDRSSYTLPEECEVCAGTGKFYLPTRTKRRNVDRGE